MTANTDKNNYIIKLYLLDDQNVWKDAGKGYLHIQKLWNSQTEIEEDTIEILLCDSSEKVEISEQKLEILKKNIPKDLKEAYLLRSAVKKENLYEKQTNKVITCIDKDLNEEIAISFLDNYACNETWRLICNAIGKNPHQDQIVETKDLECLVLPSLVNLDSIILEVLFIIIFKVIIEIKKKIIICFLVANKNRLDGQGYSREA